MYNISDSGSKHRTVDSATGTDIIKDGPGMDGPGMDSPGMDGTTGDVTVYRTIKTVPPYPYPVSPWFLVIPPHRIPDILTCLYTRKSYPQR